ncbi:BrxA family protein [Leptolyngbya sp. BC1307]|uniref:BrxA family protein n=1 Tax=Leptolyngbya sp. BC1307 TaxID=2029589 RepID=UPI001F0A19A3|nr:BrxA family protein [Leptolyngbya sp. BC1307]
MFSLLCRLTLGNESLYTARLQAGLGLISETKSLLLLWKPDMTVPELYRSALESGMFPSVTARRLRNIVVECFATRYLVDGAAPAKHLQKLLPGLTRSDLQQLLLLFTCRTNAILADFIYQIYWPRYEAGDHKIHNETARAFIEQAIDDGKTVKRWSDKTIRRTASHVTGCCADYGLLEDGPRRKRKFLPFHITDLMTVYLAYDLHHRGFSDKALLNHPDWALFGLDWDEVLAALKRLALDGWFLLQAGGEVVRISWKYPNMEAVCDVLAEG